MIAEHKNKLKCEIYNDSMQKEWRDVIGFEGFYQVSNYGGIRSVNHFSRNNTNGGKRMVPGKVIKPYRAGAGYAYVTLSKNEKRHKVAVHRIVAETFIPNDDNLDEVNHIDGDKANNSVENLEWVSHKDNIIHMVKNGLTRKATPVMCVETGMIYASLCEAEKGTGVYRRGIKKACESGDTCMGKHWEYAL